MTRKEALAELIAAVECGIVMDWGFCTGYPRAALQDHWETGMHAFCGSLDAAKALHEAVLPGWRWEIGVNLPCSSIAQVWETPSIPHQGVANYPARAWLLAILKALHAQEGEA